MTTSPTLKKTTLSVFLTMTILVTSCGNQSVAGSDEKPESIATKIPPIMNRDEQIKFSLKDLARKLEIDLDTVKLSGSGTVTWRSGALGCPKADMQYTQALVPGVLIMVKVGNTPYRYHATPTGTPFYCPDDQAESPSYTASDI